MNKLFLSLAAAGLVSLLLYNCKAVDAENERRTLQMLKEINSKFDSLDARLKRLEEERQVKPVSGMDNNTAPVALEKITLPDNPTREQVSEYIQKIANASRDQRFFRPDDLQVTMLLRVGNKNLDLLLKYYSLTFYIQMAIQNMVTQDDKEVILKALKENRNLIMVVLRMGWEKDAKELIIQELKIDLNNLPPQWIEAAATFKDPKTYPDLIEYFVNADSSYITYITYKIIRKLPGIELEDAVSKMWNKKCLLDNYQEKDNVAMIAVEWGHLDALGYLVNRLSDPKLEPHISEEITNIVWQVTGQSGSPAELASWVKENGDNLAFDEKSRKYVVKKAGDAK